MPKGIAAPHETVCQHCEQPFITTRIGRAAMYCHSAECDATRLGDTARRRAAASARHYARNHDPHTLRVRDTSKTVERIAVRLTPTEANLKRAVTFYRTQPSSRTATLMAAAALALAVDLGHLESQIIFDAAP